MTNAQRETQAKACERLRELLKPGDTVYTILRHRARSGMFRVIAPVVIVNGDPLCPCWLVADAIGAKVHREHEGISMGGCGMDMGFHLVHNLGYALWRDGFGCIGERCPSNDHSNGDRMYFPHCTGYDRLGQPIDQPCILLNCNGPHWHQSGGYALRHRWL